RVEFPGWLGTQAIQELVSQCRVGVFPSRVESFGLSVVEAMASGLPIVAARGGAIPENVENGVTGTLVPTEDSDALAAALVAALKNSEHAETLAREAWRVTRQKFSWDRAADQMIELYRSVRKR
ncbi:MAG: glycosyltransferase, partial [Nitrospinae bacterium]|nr:glycosyltransferase [Nitrospinota bacterium]